MARLDLDDGIPQVYPGPVRHDHAMKWKHIALIGIPALTALFMLFEVRLEIEFSLPRQTRQPDPEQEARYAGCFAERDKEIHATAFGTIDNPDVQKLYISNERDAAAGECRESFPEKQVTVDQPFRFNLIDLKFRF